MNVIKRSEVILAKTMSLGNGRNPVKGDSRDSQQALECRQDRQPTRRDTVSCFYCTSMDDDQQGQQAKPNYYCQAGATEERAKVNGWAARADIMLPSHVLRLKQVFTVNASTPRSTTRSAMANKIFGCYAFYFTVRTS